MDDSQRDVRRGPNIKSAISRRSSMRVPRTVTGLDESDGDRVRDG